MISEQFLCIALVLLPLIARICTSNSVPSNTLAQGLSVLHITSSIVNAVIVQLYKFSDLKMCPSDLTLSIIANFINSDSLYRAIHEIRSMFLEVTVSDMVRKYVT